MRKLKAFFLLFSLISLAFLCACGGKEKVNEKLEGDWYAYNLDYDAAIFLTFNNGEFIQESYTISTKALKDSWSGTYKITSGEIKCRSNGGTLTYKNDYNYKLDSAGNLSFYLDNNVWEDHPFIKY